MLWAVHTTYILDMMYVRYKKTHRKSETQRSVFKREGEATEHNSSEAGTECSDG